MRRASASQPWTLRTRGSRSSSYQQALRTQGSCTQRCTIVFWPCGAALTKSQSPGSPSQMATSLIPSLTGRIVMRTNRSHPLPTPQRVQRPSPAGLAVGVGPHSTCPPSSAHALQSGPPYRPLRGHLRPASPQWSEVTVERQEGSCVGVTKLTLQFTLWIHSLSGMDGLFCLVFLFFFFYL